MKACDNVFIYSANGVYQGLYYCMSVKSDFSPAVCHPPLLCRVDLVCPVPCLLCCVVQLKEVHFSLC